MVHHPGSIIPRDTAPGDAVDEVLAELPFTRDEVDELLYGSDQRPAGERLDRLRELADNLRTFQAGDMVSDDAASLLDEIEDAISGIESGEQTATQGLPEDPTDHRETLAPDSDEYEALEAEDAEDADALRRLDGPDEGERPDR